jgi:hypothetical protein
VRERAIRAPSKYSKPFSRHHQRDPKCCPSPTDQSVSLHPKFVRERTIRARAVR